MGGAFLGFPVRPARLRVRRGLVDAPGLGVRIAYEPGEPAETSELTPTRSGSSRRRACAPFASGAARRSGCGRTATGPVRAEPLAALGFPVESPPSLLYGERASFEAELPRAAPGIAHRAGGAEALFPCGPGGQSSRLSCSSVVTVSAPRPCVTRTE